jgi:hypothetical protein
VGAGEELVPASEFRALQHQVRELQRLLGKKALENESLREALDLAQPKTAVSLALIGSGRHAMKRVADTLGVARSDLAVQAITAARRRRGRRPQPDAELLGEIEEVIAALPTYGYRRVHAMIPPATCPRLRRAGQRQAGLSGDEGARSVARTSYRRRREPAARQARCGRSLGKAYAVASGSISICQ